MADAAPRIEPFFLDSPRGNLFCLYLLPSDRKPRGGIVYLHPFAEEMHKSRRMAACQARALAAAGYAVLQPDLTGCGDSGGDFGDADWDIWQQDAQLALTWLSQHCDGPLSLWGLRLGGSLATQLAQQRADIERLILWQPVVNGELFLNQFLRIKLASEMLSAGHAQSDLKQLRARLESEETIEIGGYSLAPALARTLATWKLSDYRPTCSTHWFEIGTGTGLTPASQRIADAWQAAGVPLHTHAVAGESFWITQEISECPALLNATLQALTP